MVERLEENLVPDTDLANLTLTMALPRFRVTLVDFELSGWYPE